MATPIGTSTSASAAQTTRVSAGADARPQVQSRRVSLKLGPLGITYSSDQVLWTEAAAVAGISASAASGEAEGVEFMTPVTPAAALVPFGHDAAAGQQAEATEQARQSQDAQAAGRSFSLELAQAWRRQVEEKVRAEQTYDRGGAVHAKGSPGGKADGSGAAQEAGPAANAAAPHHAAGTAGSAAATTASSSAATSAAQQPHPPASRMRQAIGAYLTCARNFSAVAPMLTAVA